MSVSQDSQVLIQFERLVVTGALNLGFYFNIFLSFPLFHRACEGSIWETKERNGQSKECPRSQEKENN